MKSGYSSTALAIALVLLYPSAAIAQSSLEADRELLGLYLKLGETENARAVAGRILKEYPNDKPALIALGYLYLEKKEKQGLRSVVKKLQTISPTDPEIQYLAASSLQVSVEPAEAKTAFQRLKEEWREGPFPHEMDLATAANDSRDWPTAMESYKQLLASGTLKSYESYLIRQALDELYRAHLPRLEAQYRVIALDEGSIQRSEVNYSHDLHRHLRVSVELRTDYVDQENEPGTPGRSRLRSEGLVGFLWNQSLDWDWGGWLGASDAYPLLGATVRKKLGKERTGELEVSAYEKATDSLLLETLDGRQNVLASKIEWAISKDLYSGLDLKLREVVVDYESIGQGLIAEWYIQQVLWRAEPKISVQYHGAVSLFDPNREYDRLARKYGAGPASDPDSKQELITDYIQRHGIDFIIEEDLGLGIVLRGAAGVEYAVELGSFEYNWLAGGSWFPRKSLELYSEVAYSSSAAASNQSSSSIQLTCGFRYYF